jgi:hypothetical protein
MLLLERAPHHPAHASSLLLQQRPVLTPLLTLLLLQLQLIPVPVPALLPFPLSLHVLLSLEYSTLLFLLL